jgi:hypothetical protein
MSEFADFWVELEMRNGNLPPRRLYPLQQYGGASTRRSRLYVKGHPITVLETGDHRTVVAYGGAFSPVRPCFKMDLDLVKHHAILQDVVRPRSVTEEACFDDGHYVSSDVIRAIYTLAQHRGIRTLEYSDNSSKHCSPESEERLHLADFYTLLYGKTWYESVFLEAGATSMIIRSMRTPEQLLEDRRHAAEVSWETMRGNIISPSLPAGVDVTAPGSGRIVLRYLRSLNDPRVCEFLGANLSEFLENSHVKTIHGSLWLCVIPPRATERRRQTRRRRSSRYRRRSTYRRIH